MRLYPIRFTPFTKEKIWGSDRLHDFLPEHLPARKKIGESWQIADRTNTEGPVSVVANGWHEGKTIQELMNENPEELLGSRVTPDEFGRFPLMIKFLDASEPLSIQVHPPTDYARLKEKDMGKLEAWYIIDADEDAEVIRGVLPDVGPEDLLNAIREDRPRDVLNCIPISAGDVIFVPPGIVHSIGGGALFCEVQQNSDVTYRIYDWKRLTPDGKSRELHFEKAMEVIDFEAMGRTRARPSDIDGPGDERQVLVRSTEFIVEKVEFSRQIKEENSGDHFDILIFTEGSCYFRCGKNNGLQFGFEQGQTYLMPARMGDYLLTPEQDTTVLRVKPEQK